MGSTVDKGQISAWVFSIIQEHVENKTFGTITVAMANGKISNVKCEVNQKPPVDPDKGMP